MRRPGRLYDFIRYTETEKIGGIAMFLSWLVIGLFTVGTAFFGPSASDDMDLLRLTYSAIVPAFPELSIGVF